MSEYITLESPSEIDNWIDQNHSTYYPHGDGKGMTLQELLECTEENQSDQLPDGMLYFGVKHTVFAADGRPLVTVERVFAAKNAEEALAGYVFGPTKHVSGRGNNYLGVILRTNLTDRPQRIRVFRMAEGTDCFY